MAKVLKIKFSSCYVRQLLCAKRRTSRVKKLLVDHNLGEEDERLFADYLLSLLETLSKSGASHSQMADSLNFFVQFVKNTRDNSLIDAVRTLHRTLGRFNSLNSDQLQDFIEHVNTTYFQHFNLYKYILNTPQEQDYTKLEKEVCVPDCVGSLSESMDEALWIYEEEVRTINEKYEASLTALQRSTTSPTPQTPCFNKNQSATLDDVPTVVSQYMKKKLKDVENEISCALQVTELTCAKELAIIEATKIKAKASSSMTPIQQQTSTRSSASRKSLMSPAKSRK